MSSLKNFFDSNLELFEKSKKRLFVDLYATNNYELSLHQPKIGGFGIRKKVLEELLVMKRKRPQSNQTQYVHILPIVDNRTPTEQITSKELELLLRSTNSNSSLFVLPHSYYDFLSDDFTPLELQCIYESFQFSKEQSQAVVFTKKHMRLLKKIYGFDSMPYISQGRNSSFVEQVRLQSARNTIFSPIFQQHYHKDKITGGISHQEKDYPGSFYKYRSLREIVHRTKIKALDTMTRTKKIDFGGTIGIQEVVYEQPFDRSFLKMINKDEYQHLKKEAQEYLQKNISIQQELF